MKRKLMPIQKLLSFLLAIALLFGMSAIPAHSAETYKRGDVNGDRDIDILDILAVRNVINGAETRPDVVARANVNGDDDCDILDMRAVINIILGKYVEKPEIPEPPLPVTDNALSTRGRELMTLTTDTFWRFDVPGVLEVAGVETYCDLWSYVAFIGAVASAYNYDTLGEADNRYEESYREVLAGLDKYQAVGGAGYTEKYGGTGDVYYNDNAQIAILFLDAYGSLGDTAYLEKALQIAELCFSGWDNTDKGAYSGGIFRGVGDTSTKNACSSAATSVMAARLYQILGISSYLDRAKETYSWTKTILRDTDGIYFDSINSATNAINQGKYSQNTGYMITAGTLLYDITKDESYLQDANYSAQFADYYFFTKSQDHYILSENNAKEPWFQSVLSEAYLNLAGVTGSAVYIDHMASAVLNGYNSKNSNGFIFSGWQTNSGDWNRLRDQAGTIRILFELAAYKGTSWNGEFNLIDLDVPVSIVVQDVINMIDALPDTVDEAAVKVAREAYNTLTETQKNQVNNYNELLLAEEAVFRAYVQAVIDIIAALPDTVDEKLVTAARAAYDKLTVAQKDKVTNYADLVLAEAAVSGVYAQAVIDIINALPSNPDKRNAVHIASIEAARAAYDKLTVAQQDQVTNYNTLLSAEQVIKETSPSDENGIISGAFYTLTAKTSNKLVTVLPNYASQTRPNAYQWQTTGSDTQRYIITSVETGYYSLINVASNKALTVQNGSTENGTRVRHETYAESNSQKWKLELIDGYYKISPKSAPGSVLDIENNSTENAANVQQYESNDSDAQRFRLAEVTPQLTAPSEAIANLAFDSFMNKFYTVTNGKGIITNDFWKGAEMWEVVIDAYERTGNLTYKKMIGEYYDGFVNRHGSSWGGNKYNDDIMWMVIGCSRAYAATGEERYKTKAKEQFDLVYNRAWKEDSLGYGLYWTTDNNNKNSCINGPATIAACYIYDMYSNDEYLQKAIAINAWQRERLYNSSTGQIYDAWNRDSSGDPYSLNEWASTYNQGTFIGASQLLYERTGNIMYLNDAVKVSDYTKTTMYKNNPINSEGGGNEDLHGFKGILVRWMGKFNTYLTTLSNEEYTKLGLNAVNYRSRYTVWLQLNAKTAWNNRNTQNLMWTEWQTQTAEDESRAWGCSAAVALLQICPMP